MSNISAAALAYLVIRQQDAVGLATFDRAVGQVLRPASTPMHLSQLCALLDRAERKGIGDRADSARTRRAVQTPRIGDHPQRFLR